MIAGTVAGAPTMGNAHPLHTTLICLEGTTLEAAPEPRGRNSILCDLFDDQMNIVQLVSGDEKHSVLVTRGDGLERLS